VKIMRESKKMKTMPENQLTCPACDSIMKLKQGAFGEFWGCPNFPECDMIWDDGFSNKPTRDARKKAHSVFDKLWKTKEERTLVYKWLSEKLGIPIKDCHIKQFDIKTCNKVIELCLNRWFNK